MGRTMGITELQKVYARHPNMAGLASLFDKKALKTVSFLLLPIIVLQFNTRDFVSAHHY